ncbi:MAG: thiamine-phosphate kinase [Candidatus Omnitrophota bacterium]|nr:thiamine-phosphate kinase [Candidatus Omnitrophota bacterium]
MLIKDIGEFGLIDRIRKISKTGPSVIKGIGDDCAVVKYTPGKYLLLTSDMLICDVDFTSTEKPYLVGRKALAVSLSDIAACAGVPLYALVSLGVPARTKIKYIDEFYRGMNTLAKKYKVSIIGGDLSRSRKITVDVSVAAEVDKEKLVLRNGARRDDIIMVSGRLGGSIKGKHLKFTPRVKEAIFLTKNFRINSMIDISDGLTQDLGHILKESSHGAIIYEDLIPLSKSARSLNDALNSGEDFELLFTLSIPQARKLLSSSRKFIPIGHIIDKRFGLVLLGKNGRAVKIKPRGFKHF